MESLKARVDTSRPMLLPKRQGWYGKLEVAIKVPTEGKVIVLDENQSKGFDLDVKHLLRNTVHSERDCQLLVAFLWIPAYLRSRFELF
jgi:ABC-type Na+ transport system ATPase subunit NatA